MRVRPSGQTEADYWDRYEFAQTVVTEAERKLPLHEGNVSYARRMATETFGREPNAEERAACARVIDHNDQAVKASALTGRAFFSAASLLDPWQRFQEPANAELRIEALEVDGYIRTSNWLLAEAHWAEAFRAPTFSGFARWCIQAGPIAFSYYFGTLVRRSKHHYLRSAHVLVILAALVALLEFVLIGLMLLALVPIPKLRELLAKIQRTLTGTLGDSYIFINDDFQRRAILDRVRRDLRWLLARCRKVVVVAHSLGAAVVHRVLKERPEGDSKRLHSVITLGSGIQAIAAIEKALNDPDVLIVGWVAVVGIVLLLVGAWWIVVHNLIAGVIAVLVGVMAILVSGAGAAGLQCVSSVSWIGDDEESWTDFYAAFDPVPFGPVQEEVPRLYQPTKIHNRDSLLTDHNSYWDNKEEFVGPLTRHIATEAEFRPLDQLLPDDATLMQRGSNARASRVRVIRWTRLVFGLCTIMLLVAQGKSLVDIGRWSAAWILSKLGLGIAASDLSVAWVQALFLLVPALGYVCFVLPSWESWGNRELAAILRRERAPTPTLLIALFTLTATGVAHFSMYFAMGHNAAAFVISWIAVSFVLTCLLYTIQRRALSTVKHLAPSTP